MYIMGMSVQPYNVLTSPPYEGFMPQDLHCWLNAHAEERSLAHAYAAVHNKIGLLCHEADEVNDPWLQEALDSWDALSEELYTAIVDILSRENQEQRAQHVIQGIGRHFIVKPFMLRNGYIDGQGWWFIP